jgi:hypothetical protein
MKHQIQLQIPEPCHENWNKMSVTEQGRFCLACKKEVIDFSAMTDQEILRHISSAVTGVCGRADNSQLNRALAPAPEPRKLWWKYWMGIAASMVIIASRSNAQKGELSVRPAVTVPKLPVKTMRPVVMGKMMPGNRHEMVIHGRVVDGNGIGVAYASVTVKDMGLGIATDSAGYFALHSNIDLIDAELLISSVGYQQKGIEMNKLQNKENMESGSAPALQLGDIILRPALMEDVVVIGYKTQGLHQVVVGGVSAVRCRSSRFEKAKAKLKEVLGRNEIKIYPNPVAKNTGFNISFNIKKPGEYVVQFIDASGKILAGKKINIVSTNYTERFEGGLFGASGIYFVRVTGKDAGNSYTAKLMVP